MTKDIERTLFRREWWGQPAFSQVQKLYGKEAWVQDLDITHELFAHRGCVNALSWSRSGELLASGSDDQTVQIHTTSPNFHLNTTINTGHTANIFSVKFMPYSSDRTIITAAGDSQVKVFDIEYAPKCNDTRYLRRRPLGGFRSARQAYANVNASNIIFPNETTRTYRSHSNRAKRIVTEDSPYLFLSCSEDGDVRQFDIRLPSSEYPRSPRSRNQRSEKHPPLISYKKYQIDLNTISCSINQPHYIALGGDHRYCFLHDRRMTGRDISDERGSPGGSATIEQVTAATRCVKRFGPKRKEGRASDGIGEQITACRISDANPNELLVSWQGDNVYLFDINRAPDAGEKIAERTQQTAKGKRVMKDSSARSSSRQSKKRRTGNGSEGSSRSRSTVRVYGSRAARTVTIPKVLVTLRRELFSNEDEPPVSENPEEQRQRKEYFKKKFDQASCTAKILLDRMRQVAPKLDERKEADDDPVSRQIQASRKRDRRICMEFAQTAGALARAMGGQILDDKRRPIPDIADFDGVDPSADETDQDGGLEAERFSHVLLRLIVACIMHGCDGVEQLALEDTAGSETSRQERIDQYFDTLSARAFQGPLLATGGEGRVLFESGRDILRAFRLFYVNIEDASLLSEESRAFWARDVGRALLMKDASEINHLFTQTAFRGAEDFEEWSCDEDETAAVIDRLLGRTPMDVSQTSTPRRGEGSSSGTQHHQDEDTILSDIEGHSGTDSDNDSDVEHQSSGTMEVDVDDDEAHEGDEVEEDDEEEIDDDGLDEEIEEDDDDESSDLEEDSSDDDDEDEDSDGDLFGGFGLHRHRNFEKLESQAPISEHIKTYTGHCNVRTVKDVNFFGLNDEYVVSGSDCGNVFIWEKSTGALKQLLKGDSDTVNVIEGHPFEPRIAVSGIDDTVKIFGPDQVEQAEFRRLAMRRPRRQQEMDSDSGEDSEDEETRPFISESSAAANLDNHFDTDDFDPEQPLPGYNGIDEDGISRRNLHNAYSIMSRNEQMRESGVGEAVFTRQLFSSIARRIQQNRAHHMHHMHGTGAGGGTLAGGEGAENEPLPGGVMHIEGDCQIM